MGKPLPDIAYVGNEKPDEVITDEVTAEYIAACDDMDELMELLNAFVFKRDSIADQLDTAKEFGDMDQDWVKRAKVAYNYTKEGIRRVKYRIDQLKGKALVFEKDEEIRQLKAKVKELHLQVNELQAGQAAALKRQRLEQEATVHAKFMALCKTKLPRAQFLALVEEAKQ